MMNIEEIKNEKQELFDKVNDQYVSKQNQIASLNQETMELENQLLVLKGALLMLEELEKIQNSEEE